MPDPGKNSVSRLALVSRREMKAKANLWGEVWGGSKAGGLRLSFRRQGGLT